MFQRNICKVIREWYSIIIRRWGIGNFSPKLGEFFFRICVKNADIRELVAGADYQFIAYNDETDGLRNNADAHSASAYANFSGVVKMVMYSAGLTLQYDRMSVHTVEETTLFYDVYVWKRQVSSNTIRLKKRSNVITY